MKRDNRTRRELLEFIQYQKNENEIFKMLLKQQHEEIKELHKILNIQSEKISNTNKFVKKIDALVFHRKGSWIPNWKLPY